MKLSEKLLLKSLQASNRERGEDDLKKELENIVPDLYDHYNHDPIQSIYGHEKTRIQQCFQIAFTRKAILDFARESGKKNIIVTDIGDSSGNHLTCLKALCQNDGLDLETVSINLDHNAVEKVQKKGMKAIQCRAEEVHKIEGGVTTDIFLSYQMVEHLLNPIEFFHSMAEECACSYFVVTVPYLKQSRVGLHQIRNNDMKKVFAESVHIYEFSDEDWNLIFKFAGWEVIKSEIYLQYPKFHPLRLTAPLWKKWDYEGFYGVVLKKNSRYSDIYQDWPSKNHMHDSNLSPR